MLVSNWQDWAHRWLDIDYFSHVCSVQGNTLFHFVKQNLKPLMLAYWPFFFGWILFCKCFLLHINLISKARVTGRSFSYLCSKHQTTEHVMRQTWKPLGSFRGSLQLRYRLWAGPSVLVSGGIKLEPQAWCRCQVTTKAHGWMRHGRPQSCLIGSLIYRCRILNNTLIHPHRLQKAKLRDVEN